ncbi:hypothetical protein SCORR_v1c04420 [Spiroplasma corruscae]|uniref:Uncharacterized protein n=1 Tax=Spiroplasma corruscae TaxID=216934 RepID=A0A222ENX7_9MOLU|nr:hypothetical protein [Spiroplasma corruscae]ASP28216.1 hypothetical protein SCORR_v1c04420 [Spiroplasma corruscae]
MKKTWLLMLISSIMFLIISVLAYTLPDMKYKSTLLYSYFQGTSFPSTSSNILIWLKLSISMSTIVAIISIFVLVMGYFYENTTYNKYAIMGAALFVFIAFFSGLMLLIAGSLNIGGMNSGDKLGPILLLVFINIGYLFLTSISIWTGISEYKANSLR